jgi:hypothetical protein
MHAAGHWGTSRGRDPVRQARLLVDAREAEHVRDEEQKRVAAAALDASTLVAGASR